MRQTQLKEIDRQICALLQENARLPFSEIAERVGLSVPSVSEHVRKLEEQGIIQGYNAKLNPRAFETDITAFIFITIESSVYYGDFIRGCQAHPEILECHAVTGEASHLLKVRTQNMLSLEKLLSIIQQMQGVRRTLTNLVLSTHLETLKINTLHESVPKK